MSITIFAFKDGSVVLEGQTGRKRAFKDGALPVLTVESRTIAAEVLSKHARMIGAEYYFNAALDGPFDNVDTFTGVVQSIRAEYAS